MTFRRFSSDERVVDLENIKQAFLTGRITTAQCEDALLRLGITKQGAEVLWTEWELEEGE